MLCRQKERVNIVERFGGGGQKVSTPSLLIVSLSRDLSVDSHFKRTAVVAMFPPICSFESRKRFERRSLRVRELGTLELPIFPSHGLIIVCNVIILAMPLA